MKLQVESCRLQVLQTDRRAGVVSTFSLQPSAFSLRRAFTLIEVMVVVVLLSLIVLTLMAVFDSTQTAFRASVTQADVLESGRASMDLMADDLRKLTPSYGVSFYNRGPAPAINFILESAQNVAGYSPLYQALPANSNPNIQRTNILEGFFILSRGNVNGHDSWIGTGYSVTGTNSQGGLYSLYRFTTNYPVMTVNPERIFDFDFGNFLNSPTNGSHLLDGVVHLRVRTFDMDGTLLTSNPTNPFTHPPNIIFTGAPLSPPGEVDVTFTSNAVPASVEIEMGVLEDRALQRAESLPNLSPSFVQSNYLSQQAGKVHVFRQRVSIPNVDPSAYQ